MPFDSTTFPSPMHYLIAGLGNIGEAYRLTRHNIGFEVVDCVAQNHHLTFQLGRLAHFANFIYKKRNITLLKPTTYMNESGRAVRYWVQNLKIPIEQLLVVSDDLHLPFGHLRLRTKGSHAGHNGLKSIMEELNTQKYARLRCGIDKNFMAGEQSTYVLNSFTLEEQKKLPPIIEKAAEAVLSFCLQGVKSTIQHYNTPKPVPPSQPDALPSS